MELLQIQDILLINKKTIKRHGSKFVPPNNVFRQGALGYMVEAIDGELFGQPMYPPASDKAAFYMFQIATGPIFHDGNKRSGLEAALLFLKLNGECLKEELTHVTNENGQKIPYVDVDILTAMDISSNDILETFTLELAYGKISLEDCKLWFMENIEK